MKRKTTSYSYSIRIRHFSYVPIFTAGHRTQQERLRYDTSAYFNFTFQHKTQNIIDQ